MRNQTIWNSQIKRAGLIALSAVTVLAGGACTAYAAEEAEEVEAELTSGSEDAEEIDSDIFFEEEELSPEEEELYDLIDENYAEELLSRFDSFRYEQTMYDADGKENELTGFVYRDDKETYVEYADRFIEYITEDFDDGFDPELDAPVRYVFANEETKEDNLENYDELFYLWGDETVADRSEENGKILFTTENRDSEFVSYIAGEAGIEATEDAFLKRVSTFDEETSVMEYSVVTLVNPDGTEKEIFHCSFTVDPEETFEPDAEVFDKLNAEDTHALKLVIDPGEPEEMTVESTVGKGCVFYPLVYDGYTYFTDPECTLAATEEDLYDKEKDIVLYAKFEEIPEDEYALSDDGFEIELEDGDIDIEDLFEVVDEEESE